MRHTAELLDPSPPAGAGTAARLAQRWRSSQMFVIIGATGVVAGGIVAAVTRPTGFEPGPWVAAYAVLVVGVAQIALGAGQAWLAATPPSRRLVGTEVICWNTAAVLTVAGTLAGVPALTTLGGVGTAAALVLFLVGVGRDAAGPRWTAVLYRTLVTVVLLSAPIGVALSWSRHG